VSDSYGYCATNVLPWRPAGADLDEISWFAEDLTSLITHHANLVAMRFYITTPSLEKSFPIPEILVPCVRYAKPVLASLISQAVDEAAGLGRLGIGVCGPRSLTAEMSNCVADLAPEIYIHTEDFGM
jgi:hypothetical protein